MTDLGPPTHVWRDDPLFNQGHVAAELALAALRSVDQYGVTEEGELDHAIERLEAFLAAAREEARERAG